MKSFLYCWIKFELSFSTNFWTQKRSKRSKSVNFEIVSSILPKERTKNHSPKYFLKITLFVCFLEELRTPYITFEIFWPYDFIRRDKKSWCLPWIRNRGVSGEWAIAHPDFGRIESATVKRRQHAHCFMYYLPNQI